MKEKKLYRKLLSEGVEELAEAIRERQILAISKKVADLLFLPKTKPLRDKIEAILRPEFEKVQQKDHRLADAQIVFDGDELADDEKVEVNSVVGLPVMLVYHYDPKTIVVNMRPFVMLYKGTEASFNSIMNTVYMYDEHGHHNIQHECAHIIDLDNGHEDTYTHNERFEKTRRELESIEPHLDKQP